MNARPAGRLRVVLAFNLKRIPLSRSDEEAEFDSPEAVDAIAASLQRLGCEVVRIEADRFFPLRLADAAPDAVFNLAEAVGGRSREAYVPAVCELMRVRYTGSDPATLAAALDKTWCKRLLAQAGVPTPAFRRIDRPGDARRVDLPFPLILKPNHEGSSKGLSADSVVRTREELEARARRLLEAYEQPVIAEEFLPGREFSVGFLGAADPEPLPLLEYVYLDPSRPAVYDLELKQDPPDKIQHVCPAQTDDALAARIVETARRAYLALECRDVGRVDVRLDAAGDPQVLEVNPLPGLTPRYSDLCKMTEALGWPHEQLIDRILQPALRRNP